MKEKKASGHTGFPRTLSRRELLCAAAAGGALMVTDNSTAMLPDNPATTADPGLRAALRKYGGEFGRFGRGGSHGGL